MEVNLKSQNTFTKLVFSNIHYFLVFRIFSFLFSLKTQMGDREKLGGKLSEDEEIDIEGSQAW